VLCAAVCAAVAASTPPRSIDNPQQVVPWVNASLRRWNPAIRIARKAPANDDDASARMPKMADPTPRPFESGATCSPARAPGFRMIWHRSIESAVASRWADRYSGTSAGREDLRGRANRTSRRMALANCDPSEPVPRVPLRPVLAFEILLAERRSARGQMATINHHVCVLEEQRSLTSPLPWLRSAGWRSWISR
jgi:hypothetical protein